MKRKMIKSCEGCKYRFGYIKASELKRNCDKVCINFNRYKPTPPVLANSQEKEKQICGYCGGDIAIRNPTGKCDHLYYPENVNTRLKPKQESEQLFSTKGE